jgi:hypothetical protein
MENEAERFAREYIEDLLNAGKAQEIMEAYSDHGQSCPYVWGILVDVANSKSDGISNDVKNFAANLLDDWLK